MSSCASEVIVLMPNGSTSDFAKSNPLIPSQYTKHCISRSTAQAERNCVTSPDCNIVIFAENDAKGWSQTIRSVEANGFVTKSDLPPKFALETRRVAMENNTSFGGKESAAGQGEPWCGLLTGAAPRDHIVQLYQDQQFLNRAVCRFAASATC